MELNSISSSTSSPRPWFVFIGEGHQGPFSLQELRSHLAAGAIGPETFVWHEGMTDWLPLAQVEALREGAIEAATISTPLSTYFAEVSLAQYEFLDQPSEDEELPDYATAAIYPRVEINMPPPAASPAVTNVPNVAPKGKLQDRRLWAGAAVLGTLFILGAVSWYFSVRRLPALNDVTAQEYRELKAAAADSLSAVGPSLAIAMSQTNPVQPVFYVASNLPEDTRVEVLIVGMPETLVDRFHVSARAQVTLHNGLAKSPAFSEETGQPYPRGQYQVSVTCLGCRGVAPTAILAKKVYFAGGAADESYQKSLEAYHLKLRSQAAAELVEIKQMAEMLERQLHETTTAFQASAKTRKHDWPAFHERWSGLELQLSLVSQGWTPQTFENRFFYGQTYALLKQVSDLVDHIHAEQTEYVMNGKEDQTLNQRIISDTSIAQNSVLAVETKVVLFERSAPTQAGMPPK